MSILVFGQSGQVAQALGGYEDTICLSRAEADLTRPEDCAAAIRNAKPKAVINAAAYTAVDKAEDDAETAQLINAAAPEAMAAACAELGIPFVSISTDYVFDGSGETPWTPDQATAPINTYGQTKLDGEQAIAKAGGAWAVLRTSWVFAPGGQNFVNTMLRLGKDRDALTIVGDQIGGPTPAKAIAEACMVMAKALIDDPAKSGIYHFSGAPDVSWADFATEIFAQANLSCAVTPIETKDYPTPAKRPLNSRLDCGTLQETFGISRPDWRAYLAEVIEWQAKDSA